VDFAIYLRPSFSDVASDRTEAAEALRNLRSAAPELSANHTDMEPLKEGPITVSVETKRSGDGADKAELQIGTWQAAQWKMLAQQTERVGGSLQGLPFLPCLIIHGHDWNFAATSREGTKTVSIQFQLLSRRPTNSRIHLNTLANQFSVCLGSLGAATPGKYEEHPRHLQSSI